MNKTKSLFVAIAMVLVLVTVSLLAGCSDVASSSHEHDLSKVAPKAATCTKAGNREYYVCNDCDETFADKEGRMKLSAEKYVIPAKGHNVLKHGEKSATCSSTGVKEYFECRGCGTLFKDAAGVFQISEPTSIQMLSHLLSKVEAKPAVGFVAGWKEHYACANCDNIYNDALGFEQTSRDAIRIAPVLTDFEYKIAFTPAANLDSSKSGANHISAAYTTMDGMPATQFTFKPGATIGMEAYAWIHQTISSTMDNGQNLRIPSFSGVERKLELIVKNDGSQSISFRYYAENDGDKGGIELTIAAGETKTFKFSVNPGGSTGCNYGLKLLSNVSEETKVTMYGYFYCEDEVDSISFHKQPSKTTFKVGEKFSTDGLVVKAHGDKYDEVVIANYLTDVEEDYVFTADDVGKRTITVAYGEYTTTYEITISQ